MAQSRSTARAAMNSSRGFTLVEVLVALVVLAVALAAVIRAAGETASNANYLRDRTFAHWVAMNQLTEMQIGRVWTTGRQDSERRFARRTWPVEVVIEDTQFPNLRRVDVTVAKPDDPDRTLATVTGLLTDPEVY